MENFHLENYQLEESDGIKDLIENSLQSNNDFIENACPSKFIKDNSRSLYLKLTQQISSNFLLLQDCQDKVDFIRLINTLHELYLNPVILNEPNISSNLPIDEILYDLLLNELLMKADFEFLFALFNLFILLIKVYQDSVISILLQTEFIENIFSLFNEPLPLEMKSISFDFLFQILNFNKKSIDQSTFYFDDLYQIVFNEINSIDIGEDVLIIHQFLKYIEMLICFQPQFICSKDNEVSHLIDLIFQRQDLNLFFKSIIDVIILLIDSCFDTFSPSLPCIPALTIILDNWESENNLIYQSLNLRFIEKVASHKFSFEIVSTSSFQKEPILYQICHFVSQYWERSTTSEIMKLSLKTAHSLIDNYDESLPIFIDDQIIMHMICIYNSDQPFEIKKLAGLIIFHVIFLNFDVVCPDNFDDIHDIFNDLSDTNIICPEVIDVLQQRFDQL